MRMWQIHQEDITTVYVYTYICDIRAPKYIKQILTYLLYIYNNPIIVKDWTSYFSNEEIIQTENW